MKNIVKCAALGLSVAASSLAIAKPASANPWYFANFKANQEGNSICMGVSGGVDQHGHIADGTHIITWTCSGAWDQDWTADPVPGQPLQNVFRNKAQDAAGNNMCLTDASFSSDRGQPLTVYPCSNNGTGGPGQRFQTLNGPNGGFLLMNVYSGRVIGVANGQANPITNGMAIIMWDRNGSPDQEWIPLNAP